MKLRAEQVECWHNQGFALVDGVLPVSLLEAARSDAATRFPAAGSSEAEAINDFGSGGRMQFPSESTALNAITLHPPSPRHKQQRTAPCASRRCLS